MFSTLFHTALFVAFVVRQASAEIQISTPILTQCQDVNLEWSGGNGPYNIYVVPSEDSCADSVVDIPEQSGTSFKWKVNIPAGSSVEILVEDSERDEGWTGVMKVAKGSDSSCVDKQAAEKLLPDSKHTTPLVSSGAGSSGTGSSGYGAPPPQGSAAPVVPESTPPVANAANNQDNNAQSSGSIARVAFPAGSLLTAVAFLVTAVHI